MVSNVHCVLCCGGTSYISAKYWEEVAVDLQQIESPHPRLFGESERHVCSWQCMTRSKYLYEKMCLKLLNEEQDFGNYPCQASFHGTHLNELNELILKGMR